MTELIDVHSHFVPDWYSEQARRAGHDTPDGMPAWPAWNVADHLRLMDERGIGRSLLSLSTPGVTVVDPAAAPALAARVNDAAAAVCGNHPDRFGFLASLPLPDVGAALAEAERALDTLGASGVILQTHSRGTYVTDATHDELWAMLAARRIPVLLHPTSPPGWEATALGYPRPMIEFLFDTARVVCGLLLGGALDRYPGLRLVIPHSGGVLPLLVARASVFQQGLRWLAPPRHPTAQAADFRAALRELWWDLAGSPDETALGALSACADEHRLVYGSDYCFTPAHAVGVQQDVLDRCWKAFGGNGSWRSTTAANAAALLDPAR
ncbi:amidohydrolase family protein [Nocardia sp. BMG111209]|uniref:amidohydrolase family protein n=1 Tax=Nocardia sp. BMG111209 TaxID=1160137 RepID=UPI000373F32A|nr:amidohydrolase family protein [Nocardia sp. BMG111209]